MKVSAAERYKIHYARPMPKGSGLPMVSSGQYKGLQLSPWVQERIASYRALPSLYGERK